MGPCKKVHESTGEIRRGRGETSQLLQRETRTDQPIMYSGRVPDRAVKPRYSRKVQQSAGEFNKSSEEDTMKKARMQH